MNSHFWCIDLYENKINDASLELVHRPAYTFAELIELFSIG